MSGLTLQNASRIADSALDEGAKRGFAPLCIAVLDAGGHPLVIKRDERAGLYRQAIATAKATNCLGMSLGGRTLVRRVAAMPAFYQAIGEVAATPFLASPGGVLIRGADGAILGAVGISGDTGDHDEICALAGITAAGLSGDAGE